MTGAVRWLALVALASCGPRDGEEPVQEPPADAPAHARILFEYTRRAPLPTGPWKGIGDSSPKRLALVERERELLAAARSDPSPENHRLLGALYTTVGESERGLAYLVDALERAPDDSEAWTWLGANRLDRGLFDEASVLLEHAVELAPDDPHALTFLGVTRLRAGDPGGARSAFEAAVAAAPRHAEALVPLAGQLEDAGELEAARERLLVANEARPYDAPTLFRLARVCGALGRAEEAERFRLEHERVRVLDDLGLLYETIPPARQHVGLGIHYLELGRDVEALPEFEAALERDPDPAVRVNALYGRAWCLVRLGRADDAREAIDELRSTAPEHPKLEALEDLLREGGEGDA